MDDFKLLINGALVEGDATVEVINPATEEVLAQAPAASAAQMDSAVGAAKAAFPAWAAQPIEARRNALLSIADVVEANTDALARLLTLEQGKPLSQAVAEIGGTVQHVGPKSRKGFIDGRGGDGTLRHINQLEAPSCS